VKAMALIHQLLYQEGNFTRIDFGTYLKQLVTALSGIFKKPGTKVSTEIQAEQVFLDIDTSIPLGLIVTELVSNAYKYAFNDSNRGMIKITVLRNEGKTYELAVSDNGKGLPESFSIDNASSMGLKLVKILSDQLDAKLSFNNDKGTSFKLVFGER
jgi:two-component sensor histidine kinase